MRGNVELNGASINYKLVRTWGEETGAKISIQVPDTSVKGMYVYKRFKSYDTWDTLSMTRKDDQLIAILPQLPPAGKMKYHIILFDETKDVLLNAEPAILRYKGSVPASVLIPHILFMFLAMLFSMRTGFEAIFIRKHTYKLALWTLAFIVLGGLVFGPIVQKYAFDAYWTGWPFGHDLTDNKTAIAFIAWIAACLVLRKNRRNRFWPVLAACILIVVYLIPHSLMGSEIDFTEEERITHVD
jgi:hypothetical protein